jgi:hypothetical protein
VQDAHPCTVSVSHDAALASAPLAPTADTATIVGLDLPQELGLTDKLTAEQRRLLDAASAHRLSKGRPPGLFRKADKRWRISGDRDPVELDAESLWFAALICPVGQQGSNTINRPPAPPARYELTKKGHAIRKYGGYVGFNAWGMGSVSVNYPEPSDSEKAAAARAVKAERDQAAARDAQQRSEESRIRQEKIAAGRLGRCPVCEVEVPVAEGIVLSHLRYVDEYCSGIGENAKPL